jgi:hypothetical protein
MLSNQPTSYKFPISKFNELVNQTGLEEKWNDILSNINDVVYSYSEKPIFLYNKDFINGTFRINKPGLYVLKENIVFNPNSDYDFMPRPEQISSGQYPVGANGAYHLGFFAAITIETEGVILDLNGKYITQSYLHNLNQRFFAAIELASSPFIPNQGPHAFTDDTFFSAASKSYILNGKLINLSHHGIHGNSADGIVIQGLTIDKTEVAGISLHGATNSILYDISVAGKDSNIPIVSSFSQSKFLLRHLNACVSEETFIEDLRVSTAISNLEDDLNEIITGGTNFHTNPTGMYDGNMYGIVLHTKGVVINKFLESRPEGQDIGNETILVKKLNITRIKSSPREVIAFALPALQDSGAYGGKRMVGPFGDVLDVEMINDLTISGDGSKHIAYNGNSLSDAQLLLKDIQCPKGTLNINDEVYDWATNYQTLPITDFSFVGNGDTMGHFMKGNIGFFLSGGKDIHLENISIDGVETIGNDVGNSEIYIPSEDRFQGLHAYGLLEKASENITKSNVSETNIISSVNNA